MVAAASTASNPNTAMEDFGTAAVADTVPHIEHILVPCMVAGVVVLAGNSHFVLRPPASFAFQWHHRPLPERKSSQRSRRR